ncbi:MAG: hypothetical protein AB7N80_06030 [Bdellovibrionales bacterium]
MGHAEGAKELTRIFSTRDLVEFNVNRHQEQRRQINVNACRLQLQQKLVPAACLEVHKPAARVETACYNVDVNQVSAASLGRASRMKGFSKGCRRHLKKLLARKIYQEQDAL